MITERNFNIPYRKESKNWREYLIILHISTIMLLMVLTILLVVFILTSTPPKFGSPDKSLSYIKPTFFESGAVYYVKSNLGDDTLRYLVGILKTLKMDKESIKNDLKLYLNRISKSRSEKASQYFFFKAKEDTIYTFIKSIKKKKPIPGRITISILEGNNPGSPPWGIYHLEEELIETEKDATGKFIYTLDYLKGKYNEEGRRQKNYAPLAIHIKDRSLERVVNTFAEGIQKTINGNPREARRNGKNIYFKFSLYRKDEKDRYVKVCEKQLTFPLVPTKMWVKVRTPSPNVTHEEIDTFEVDHDRKNSLEAELMIAFKDLFSTKDEGASENQLEIYVNRDNISTTDYRLGNDARKIKKLLKSSEFNSLQDWQSLFKSAEIDIDCLGLIKYIDDKSEELTVSRKAIFTIIAIVVVLILYVSLWCGIKLKIKRDAIAMRRRAAKVIVDHRKDENEKQGVDTISETLEERKIVATDSGEAGKAEPSRKDPLFYLIGMQKHKLEEINDSLIKVRDKAIEIYTNTPEPKGKPNKLELDKLRVSENKVKEILDDKDITRKTFALKLSITQEILKEFRKDNKITDIDEDLEEIQKKLDGFEIPVPPKEEPIPLPTVPETVTEPITTSTDQILTGIQKDIKDKIIPALKGLDEIHTKYREIIETIKSSTSTDVQAISNEDVMTKMLDSSAKNSQLLQKVDENIDAIIKDSRDNDARLNQLSRYVNQETSLIFRKDNVLDIIDKVSGEAKISKEYRLCAVNLYEDLSNLEENYQDTWYWGLLTDGLLGKLKENINFFSIKDAKGKTIYDRYFGKEIPLRDIETEHIKKIISNHHWFQFWNELIRMSDFFNAYFDDEMADLKYVLGYYSQKIKKIFKKLGYEITHIKPLSVIPNAYKKQQEVEQADKSYIEGVILKNLVESGNKKIHKGADDIPPGCEMVVYVDRLGLIDKLAEEPVLISKVCFGAYNKTLLRSYLASCKSKEDEKNVNKK